jgi:hypothetical protein
MLGKETVEAPTIGLLTVRSQINAAGLDTQPVNWLAVKPLGGIADELWLGCTCVVRLRRAG